jgi:hypothetical protein
MTNRQSVVRAAAILAALALPLTVTYGVTRAVHARPSRPARPGPATIPIPSGRHLIAYVFLDSRCGACTYRATEASVEQLHDSLNASQAKAFNKITVIGVALDENLQNGIGYLERLNKTGRVFDQLGVGGTWSNEFVNQRVWREAAALPGVPQILLISRVVDPSGYPRTVDLRRDSVIARIFGRDEIIKWVKQGTPIATDVARDSSANAVRVTAAND